jgi:tRNA(fMet)-specific endonuclease VapC
MYLLDTDHVVVLQRGAGAEFENLTRRMADYPGDCFFYPVVAFHEQMLGAHTYIARARDRRGAVRGYALLDRVLTDFSLQEVLPFDEPAARKFDELRALRIRIGTMDLRISSIALVRAMIVLTRNIVDFRAVPGLRLEDWTAS